MASCKDCLHYDLCKSTIMNSVIIKRLNGFIKLDEAKEQVIKEYYESCNHFQDSSRFVELPVKPGTVLFVTIRNQITKYKITGICVREHGFGSERVLIEGISCSPFYSDISAIGKTAFLTREEAEQALKERKENA